MSYTAPTIKISPLIYCACKIGSKSLKLLTCSITFCLTALLTAFPTKWLLLATAGLISLIRLTICPGTFSGRSTAAATAPHCMT